MKSDMNEGRLFQWFPVIAMLMLIGNAGAMAASSTSGISSPQIVSPSECQCSLDYKVGADVWVSSCNDFSFQSPYCCDSFSSSGQCADSGSNGDYVFGCRCTCSRTYTYTLRDACGNAEGTSTRTDTWSTFVACATPESTAGIDDTGIDSDEIEDPPTQIGP